GFEHSLQGCCGTGTMEMASVCNTDDIICPDPSKYLFWDSVHLTQEGYSVLANSGQTLLPYLTS
ncbi:GDSL esterase/lipase, partial [Trifolium pratense]